MKIFYKDGDNPTSLEEAIRCCLKQIALAPMAAKAFREEFGIDKLPVHEGYDQLCFIYEKQGKYEEAIRLTEQAKEQGWNRKYPEHWNVLVDRYKAKIDKRLVVK